MSTSVVHQKIPGYNLILYPGIFCMSAGGSTPTGLDLIRRWLRFQPVTFSWNAIRVDNGYKIFVDAKPRFFGKGFETFSLLLETEESLSDDEIKTWLFSQMATGSSISKSRNFTVFPVLNGIGRLLKRINEEAFKT